MPDRTEIADIVDTSVILPAEAWAPFYAAGDASVIDIGLTEADAWDAIERHHGEPRDVLARQGITVRRVRIEEIPND